MEPRHERNHPTVNLLGWQPLETLKIKFVSDVRRLGITPQHFDSQIGQFLYRGGRGICEHQGNGKQRISRVKIVMTVI